MFNHRKASKRILFSDNTGKPVGNSKITIRQLKHDFLFGAALFPAVELVNGIPGSEKVKKAEDELAKALEIFNFATLPFYWGMFESKKGKPDTERLMKAANWFKERNIPVKGHPLCWHTVCAPWLLDMSNEEIMTAQLERITRDVSAFAGVIDMWDVINEVVIMPLFNKYDNGITRICKEKGRIKLVREVFAAARNANPNAKLLINDFDMSEAYDILIEGILESGIKLDAIGLQSHMHQGAWSNEKTAEILERFSRFNLPLHFTEINIVSGELMPPEIVDLNDFDRESWPTTPDGEERQAREVCHLYEQLFAHPSVEAITYWNFRDGGWLDAPAGFIAKDGRTKPVYNEMYELINNKWKTTEEVFTDEQGYAEITGFKGEYEAEFDNGKVTFDLR